MDWQTIKQNPVMATSLVLFASACLLTIWSSVALLGALFYQPGEQSMTLRATSENATLVDTLSLSKRNFFGEASNVEQQIVVEELPETELQLVLRGAFTAIDDAEAGAIIEDQTQKSEHYKVGDTLPGNATLQSVHANSVVLVRNGIFETLYFPQQENDGGSWSPTNTVSETEAEARREAVRKRIQKLRGGVPRKNNENK